MFDTLKNIASKAASVAGTVVILATGVALGTLAAAKATEMLKSENS